MVTDFKVGKLGGREFREMALDEALSELVAVKGMIHEECR